jgi:histidinol-phosphate/aromatic aminotransferase/cobyric acid decarboxylase-like protein
MAGESHGGDAWAVAEAMGRHVDEMVELSASLNPVFAPHPEMFARHLHALERYPDPTQATQALAEAMGADPRTLLLTNGGSEAIALLARQLGRGEIVEPEFSLYRRHLSEVTEGAGRWRSNPSNPLGVLAGSGETAAVWDEAFYPLATGRWTRGDNDAWRLGSMTKLWSVPGLRLGYVIAPSPEAAASVAADQPRWSVNGLALAVVPELLAQTDLPGWAAEVQRLRAQFVETLRVLGFVVHNTEVNWVLVERPGLREALLEHLVVVRDCSSFGLPGLSRVAIPRPADFDRVLTAFAAVGPAAGAVSGAVNEAVAGVATRVAIGLP